MNSIRRYAEVYGLAILLLAAGMQMFTLWSQSNLVEGEFWRVNQRLYIIVECMREQASHGDGSYCLGDQVYTEWVDLNQFDRRYQAQVRVFNWIYISLYFLGSIIFVTARFRALSKSHNA